MTRDDLLTISREPNVAAILDAIAACEGTDGPAGYRTRFGGSTFESFADHPGGTITATSRGREITSSAAGRYQFLERTWRTIALQYDLPSFEPVWQNVAAVALIAGRGALADVRAGRLEAAVAKLNPEWASLPGAPYNQPTKHIDFVRNAYMRAGGRLDGGAPVEARTTPDGLPPIPTPAAPSAARLERPMAPAIAVITALLPSIVKLIPELGKLLGSGSVVADRNLQIAEKFGEVIVQATQTPNLQAAVEMIQTNPDALSAARLAVQSSPIWIELVPGDGGGVAGARKAAEEAAARPGAAGWLAAVNQLLMDIAVVGGGGWMLWGIVTAPSTSGEVRSMIVGAIVGYVGAVIQFRYGSSISSRQKDTALVRELGQR
jgi:muramidase (phage lysozyme)